MPKLRGGGDIGGGIGGAGEGEGGGAAGGVGLVEGVAQGIEFLEELVVGVAKPRVVRHGNGTSACGGERRIRGFEGKGVCGLYRRSHHALS